jgi:hypothetical protein
MQNTTRPTVVALESLNPEILFNVSGGCGSKCAPPPPPAPAAAPITQVLQLQMPQQMLPQAPLAPPPPPSGPEVSTSVSINGQPA